MVEEGRSVLAHIKTITELGPADWFEVVYWNGFEWCSFAGSDTFNNGEQVTTWVYADVSIHAPRVEGDRAAFTS